jgi:hypothetical protein
MIATYETYTNAHTICPFCLNNYLDHIREDHIFEGVNDFTEEEEKEMLLGASTRTNPVKSREAPRYKVDVRSMSILVPTHGCVNACKFCVSKISQLKDEYKDLSKNELFEEAYFKQFEKVSKMGCTYCILTGTGEPIQNKPFLAMIGRMNDRLENPFKLEVQTSGVMLDDANLEFLRNEVGVYLISLSVSNIFDDRSNAEYITMHPRLRFNLKELCNRIKSKGFILRISLNLVSVYNKYSPEEVINRLLELNADQATFRVLWAGKDDNEISRWIKSNSVAQDFVENIEIYCATKGKHLPASYPKYQLGNLTIVLDEDCMAEKSVGEIRYLILRSDCNLYTRWDTASSIFK